MRVAFLVSLATLQFAIWTHCTARPMSLADLQMLSGEPDVTVDGAPDGSMLALGWNGKVILIQPKARKARTDLGAGFDPTWAPNSRWLAFYSKRSGSLQLWAWERSNNRFFQLTHDDGGLDVDPTTRGWDAVVEAFHLAWSPDGSRLAFASRSATGRNSLLRESGGREGAIAPRGPMVLTNSTSPAWTLKGILVHPGYVSGVLYSDDGVDVRSRAGVDAETQIRIVDVPGATEKWATRGPNSHFYPAWSPDGKFIACVGVPGPGLAPKATETQIVVITEQSGDIRNITSGTGVKVSPIWASPGNTIVFRQSRATFTWAKVYSVRIGGQRSPVNIDLVDRRLLKLLWSGDTDEFLVSYKDGVTDPLARIHAGAPPVLLTRARYPLAVDDFTAFGGAVAWVQLDPENLWTLRYMAEGSRKGIILYRFSRLPSDAELGRAEIVHWRNKEGTDLDGTILLPPHFTPGIRYPLIVDAYPLISGSDWTSPMFGNFAWASMGYVIFRPSPPAPHVWMNSWKAEASSDVAEGPKGWTITIDDVMSGVDNLISEGIVDPNRMCLYGFSNGGGVVDYLVTRVHRFRCAVAVAPALSDWIRPFLLNSQDEISWFDHGKDLEAGLSDYIALSAVFHLSSVDTPMLLADGDDDGGFLLDAVEMYDRLRQLGRQVTLVRYPNQGHGFTGSAMRDFWSREIAFFARNLNPRQTTSDAWESRAGMDGGGGRPTTYP